ncbi:exopolysaccharide biosynthesis polyprenyl glycosylphosphotransferase [Selenomonas sp. GACV-9]|uniref:sugar transferase n=1 Tax=Selenomonas sp. GACV-9 TaxID=3158782 RepID=UPI0008F3BE86|nr:exopolysaccharide biosynthesis polyprenyl glycosylphosphotransferase [Selenomonas ruminantium]
MRTRNFPKSRKLILLLGDVAFIVMAYIIAAGIVLDREFILNNIYLYSGMLPVIMIISGLLLNINGLYSIACKRFAEIILSTAVATLCTFILVMALSFFIQEFSYSRSVVAFSCILQGIMLIAWRYLGWSFEQKIHNSRTVMLMGTAEECDHVYNRLRLQPQLNLKLKYICTDMGASDWKRASENIDVIILCSEIRHRYKVAVINYCHQTGKTAMLIPNTYEIFCAGAVLDKIDDIPVFRPQSLYPSLEVRTLKRLLDVLVAGIGFICALPFMAVTALAIKIFDPGPILYSQIRTGKNGKEFRVYKFRTMRVDAEKYTGPMLAQENDSRITKLGKFLRTVRLDELPQIWNVVVGDMSIVGPRPERPFFVEQFTKEIPEYAYRHNVKPGITGMAQVYGKYNTTAFDKLVYDLMYIENCSILTDLSIIVQTVKVLFTKSATEGAGIKQKPIDLEKYDIGKNIYGDY